MKCEIRTHIWAQAAHWCVMCVLNEFDNDSYVNDHWKWMIYAIMRHVHIWLSYSGYRWWTTTIRLIVDGLVADWKDEHLIDESCLESMIFDCILNVIIAYYGSCQWYIKSHFLIWCIQSIAQSIIQFSFVCSSDHVCWFKAGKEPRLRYARYIL